MHKLRHLLWAALLALVIPLTLAGCGGDSSDDGGGSSNAKFVGTWAMIPNGGGGAMYFIFKDDGSWLESNNAAGTARRCFGNYIVDGDSLDGSMVNPGTGDGEITATLAGTVLSLDFIEHWHSPYKHNLYTGSQI